MVSNNAAHNAAQNEKLRLALMNMVGQVSEVKEEIHAAAEEIALDSMNRTPVDQGTLKGTTAVTHSDDAATIRVGGPAAPYAVAVHQRKGARHTVGESGFLRKAVEAAMPELRARLLKLLRI